jgi:hypothetical protein
MRTEFAMKITIDLDKLLEEEKINMAEYDKFSQLAARSTSALAFNILTGFGVIAVSGAALTLLPTPATAIVLGLVICTIGTAFIYERYEHWIVFANICVIVGALLFGGGIIKASEGSIGSFLLVATAFAGAGVFLRSSLLTVLAILALSPCLGARANYFHATYFLGIEEPALTIALFSIFSIFTYQLSKHLTANYQRISLAASRAGVFLVNFGFWIGSLWGDRKAGGEIVIADWVFALLWALVLIAAGVWAWKHHRRWMINIIAVFSAIHFYTQWFERLGASAETVLIAGLLTLSLAVGLRALNTKLVKEA